MWENLLTILLIFLPVAILIVLFLRGVGRISSTRCYDEHGDQILKEEQ